MFLSGILGIQPSRNPREKSCYIQVRVNIVFENVSIHNERLGSTMYMCSSMQCNAACTCTCTHPFCKRASLHLERPIKPTLGDSFVFRLIRNHLRFHKIAQECLPLWWDLAIKLCCSTIFSNACHDNVQLIRHQCVETATPFTNNPADALGGDGLVVSIFVTASVCIPMIFLAILLS